MSTRLNAFQAPTRQSGFTVIELLIAGVLGLVLLAGVGQLFLGSSATFRMQRQIADIQDSGRFAMWFMKSDVEKAGWFETGSPACDLACITGVDGGDDASDQLTISYDADPATGTDCNGTVVGASVQNLYFIDANRQFMCTGNGGLSQPLVSNVDSFQVLYGIDVGNPPELNAADVCADRAVDRFVLASDLAPTDIIVAVRFSLLIGGEPNTSVPVVNRRYQVADRAIEFNDQIVRRVFTLTTPVQNVPPTSNCPKA